MSVSAKTKPVTRRRPYGRAGLLRSQETVHLRDNIYGDPSVRVYVTLKSPSSPASTTSSSTLTCSADFPSGIAKRSLRPRTRSASPRSTPIAMRRLRSRDSVAESPTPQLHRELQRHLPSRPEPRRQPDTFGSSQRTSRVSSGTRRARHLILLSAKGISRPCRHHLVRPALERFDGQLAQTIPATNNRPEAGSCLCISPFMINSLANHEVFTTNW